MSGPRYRHSRQRACQQCSAAKVKCQWSSSSICTRCAQRQLHCLAPVGTQNARAGHADSADGQICQAGGPVNFGAQFRDILPSGSAPEQTLADGRATTAQTAMRTPASTPAAAPSSRRADSNIDLPDFTKLDLICPITPEAISTRWLNSYVPLPDQVAKNYPPSIISFIRRMLKSYASITIRGRGIPPFVHRLQLRDDRQSASLTTCLNLVRMCDRSFTDTIDDAAHVMKWKMVSLYNDHQNTSEAELLATFQCYLIYSLVLHFSGRNHSDRGFLRDSMLQLQELACLAARQGIMCPGEQQHVRPVWESWILCEAKRRTLYIMYLFDSLLLAEDNLPSFLGSELRGLPAPANRCLWYAKERWQWEKAYNVHLTDWPKGGLRIEELWPVPADADATELEERRERVDSWLEDLDEFGVMLFTVTSCTHGS